MEEPGTEEGAPADQSAATNTSDITNMADDIAEVSDDSEDEDEEGMKSAYSMTDMMDELDEGSDDNVNTCTTPGEDKPAAVDINKTKVSVEEGDGADGKCNRDVTAVSDTGQESCDLDVSISVDVRGDTDIITPPVNVNNAPSADTLDRVVPCSLSPERELSKSPELPDRASKVQTLSQGSATDGSLPHDYEAIGSLQGTANLASSVPSDTDGIYENVGVSYPEDDEWGSSEFESFDDSEVFNDEESQGSGGSASVTTSGAVLRNHSNKDAPALPSRNKKGRKSRSSISSEMPSPSAVLHKVAARFTPRSKSHDVEEEEAPIMEINMSMEKHSVAQLGQIPTDLDDIQVARRHIVASIVDSENSYLSSLQRIVQDYEKPLLDAKPQIISRAAIKTIFCKVKDILQCHNMFQIELAETIKVWDQEEKIGNVFNASFSKSIVFEVYSAFVNNFSVAMDAAKKQARTKQMFAEFLKLKLEGSKDKLSLFGLMVKPVQRFPQFILMLQDLLKKTPQDHHDRLPLQMALTELENLTLKLNETKRDSESRHDVKRILGQMMGRFTLKADDQRCLIRHDDMIQSITINGETKSKTRRLFLLNDQIICASLQKKQTESGTVERYRYKWSVPIQEVDIVQSTSKITFNGRKSTLSKYEPPDPPPADHPHKKDLDDLLNDLPIMQHIHQLVNSLRFKYPMLTQESLYSMIRNLKLLIQQKTDIDQSVLRLSLPTRLIRTSTDKIRNGVTKHMKNPSRSVDSDRSSSLRTVYSFQVVSPALKQDWLLELQLAKLAIDMTNRPGWYLPEDNSHFMYKLPLYGATITIDTTQQETRILRRSKKRSKVWIHCAVGILLPVPDQPGVGIQHMWVCSGEKSRGQITIVSLHTGQPYIVETFKSPGTVSVCAVRIPGTSTDGDVFDDTVWMATEDKKIHIYDILEDSRQGPALSVNTSDMVVTLCYHDNHVYAGHHKGQLAVYSRGTDGVWAHGSPCILQLGTEPVASLLVISNHVWAACGQHLHVIHKGAAPAGQQPEFEQIAHQLAQPEEGSIECMVKAGVGLIVSFRNKGIIRLFHFETLDHLQDINTASVVKNFFDDKQQSTDLRESLKRLSVTCLMASKGLLWVGTTSGCILSLPLPRLEGVPQIRCRPSVSYHAQTGPIKFLMAIHCGITALRPPPPTPTLPSPSESGVSSDGGDETVQTNGFCNTDLNVCGLVKSADYSQIMDHSGHFPEDMTLGGALRSRWISTPDLYLGSSEERMESLHTLYGSLLRGLDDDIDMELGTPKFKRRSKNMLSNLNAVSHRVGKLSGAMLTRLITQDHSQGNRAATLPVLHEDGASSHGNSSSDNVSGGSRQRDSWAESDDFIDPSVIQEDYSNDYENMDIIKQRESVERNIPAAQPHYENAEMYRNGKYNRSVSSEMVDSQSDVVIRSPVMHASHVYNKAVVVVSGGEGYINWNSQKDQNVKSDDTCLLLWQCPP